jgi:hypothetical protein
MDPFKIRFDIQKYALSIIGKPYRRKGKGPNAFDCAGAVGFVCHMAGIKVHVPDDYADSARDEQLLWEFHKQAVRQMGIAEARGGDLALMRIKPSGFFSPGTGELNYSHHCGILVETGKGLSMVHAHLINKRVKMDRLCDLQDPITAVFSVTD